MTETTPASNSTIPIPADWNGYFVFAQAGIKQKAHGVSDVDENGERHLLFNAADQSDFDAVTAAVASYPIDYLEVEVPLKLAELRALRDVKIATFTWGDDTLVLDVVTMMKLTGATVRLIAKGDKEAIGWDFPTRSAMIDRVDFINMACAASDHVEACHLADAMITHQINTAPDIDVLSAIDLDGHEAWPA